MRLLFSISYYSPYVSGLTLYVKRIAEILVKKGYQVSVICNQHEKKLLLEESRDNVRIVRAKPLFSVSKGFISVDWIIKSWKEVKKSEIVIINLPQFEGVVTAVFGKLLGKKVISIYHCEVILPEGIVNAVINRVLDTANFISLALSEKIITYTKDFAENSRLLPTFLKKVEYIYPPIEFRKPSLRVQNMFNTRLKDDPDYFIGFIGRVAEDKGLEYLLEAIPVLNEKLKMKNGKMFKIVIAGPRDAVGEETYRKRINELLEKYKNFVSVLGYLRDEELGALYTRLDVLVLPSINSTEAFGMVQVEAMIMGVPVVASDLPGVRVPIQKTGMGELVPTKNSHKLAEAIVEVLIHKNRYVKDIRSIKNEFAIDQLINSYATIFQGSENK